LDQPHSSKFIKFFLYIHDISFSLPQLDLYPLSLSKTFTYASDDRWIEVATGSPRGLASMGIVFYELIAPKPVDEFPGIALHPLFSGRIPHKILDLSYRWQYNCMLFCV
jgi:hypothetical protein